MAVFGSCSRNFEQTSRVLNLTGNPTTGYTWLYEMEPAGIIDVNSDVMYLGDGETMGAPSLFNYELTSLREGTCSLVFFYVRPWEDKDPELEMEYRITVRKNGKIKVRRKR